MLADRVVLIAFVGLTVVSRGAMQQDRFMVVSVATIVLGTTIAWRVIGSHWTGRRRAAIAGWKDILAAWACATAVSVALHGSPGLQDPFLALLMGLMAGLILLLLHLFGLAGWTLTTFARAMWHVGALERVWALSLATWIGLSPAIVAAAVTLSYADDARDPVRPWNLVEVFASGPPDTATAFFIVCQVLSYLSLAAGAVALSISAVMATRVKDTPEEDRLARRFGREMRESRRRRRARAGDVSDARR